MDRLGVVAVTDRSWRPLVGPVALLVAVSLVAGFGRHLLHRSPAPAHHALTAPAKRVAKPLHTKVSATFYAVKAGDTMGSIAAHTGVSLSQLEALNPKVSPVSLFIGEQIRLR